MFVDELLADHAGATFEPVSMPAGAPLFLMYTSGTTGRPNGCVVGEPIEPEVWRWYHSEVGKGQAAIVDTWWQTETGGFLGSGLPAIKPMKPGSCGPGGLGVYPVIYDEDGNEVLDGNAGNICIRNPWPGIFETIWGQPERFVDTY
ncbi:MAG: AMP-binding protein, partial [Streptosporangiaceae bacterium]